MEVLSPQPMGRLCLLHWVPSLCWPPPPLLTSSYSWCWPPLQLLAPTSSPQEMQV